MKFSLVIALCHLKYWCVFFVCNLNFSSLCVIIVGRAIKLVKMGSISWKIGTHRYQSVIDSIYKMQRRKKNYHMFCVCVCVWQRAIDGWPAPALETTIFSNNFKRFIVFFLHSMFLCASKAAKRLCLSSLAFFFRFNIEKRTCNKNYILHRKCTTTLSD